MKWYFKFASCAVLCAAFVALASFPACSDDDSESGPKLVLRASASSFVTGEGSVTFTVTFVDKDVTSEAVITNLASPRDPVQCPWTTDVSGIYRFQATYDGEVSNVVEVEASSSGSVSGGAFYRQVLLTKFTAVWCGPCAIAQSYFNRLKPEESERFMVVAAHQGDRLTVDAGKKLGTKLNPQGSVPMWNYNFVSSSVGTGVSGISLQTIRREITNSLEKYPAVCGVKATSTLEGSTAKIEATVQFQQAGNYKIACVLTENGIEKESVEEQQSEFNHVLRTALTDMQGIAIEPAVAEAGERSFNYEVTLKDSWEPENCEFVIYVLKEAEDGTFVANNGAVCPVGGEVGYKYEVAQ